MEIQNMICKVPSIFQVPDYMCYPHKNWPDFECWFRQNITEAELSYLDRVYLPILFTSYFKRNQYGKNTAAIGMLQDFVDTLPENKKYFCVVQYDDGVLVDWKGKDVTVFGMSGKPKGCTPIPLVCQPHSYKFESAKRSVLCSFIGRVTHPIRQELFDWMLGRPGCLVSTAPQTTKFYCEVMAKSVFAFCPRGYGESSFRISEALQYGAIPVVITDGTYRTFEDCLPLMRVDFAKGCGASILDGFYDFIKGMSDKRISKMQEEISGLHNRHYTFDAVKKQIIEALWNLL